MSAKSKKPDQVVFNSETEKYEASILPYGTNSSAPKITPNDLTGWKNSNVAKVNHQINTEYENLKSQFEDLMDKFKYNNLIYSAKFNFEPIVGQIYHLYRDKNEDLFLSLISPSECSFNYQGSFKLNEDKLWIKVEKS
ncbi:DUF2452 domain-containing protein [Psychroflexus sp. ALD_RP9]|uniref:DUF2452 domain-containing protein n=1 Tax=Psychroflexus sp. ALD_RP9 TaxID=2777186 RepID=UPI001A8C58D4|nr:DUF2452 domain-containing protein [Psychroflexus sp. ALD_RP9]QSS97053.1 DUF2452 domain-containing protein [Psychroflexus sp. ALD_RP9]